MVGLKTVWISLVALLMLASCVPQTKQTACSANEAFNSTLRTCVPVMQTPSSFINISSFSPTSTYSRYKNDVTAMNFRVNISNPYAQTYTTRWTHTYNGLSTNVTGIVTTPTTWDIFPLYFVAQVGVHLLTVDVLDSTSTVVDTHTFQYTINNSPRPYIDTTSVNPSGYSATLTPNSGNQTYSFTVKNNGAAIATVATYQTHWKLYKNGVDTTLLAPNTATEDFTDITTTGTNAADVVIDPSILTGYGIGSYVLRARLVYTPTSEVVDERQWSITIQHPSVQPVISRELILGDGLDPLRTVNAYNGVAHNSATTYNFRPITSAGPPLVLTAAQANFCVTVNDGNGTYTGDNKYVKVSYFLDGAGSPIYEGYTAIADHNVCLTDSAAVLSSVVFNNASPTSSLSHSLVARVYDVASGAEYTSSDMASGAGTYPITWTVLVKPQNEAPSVTFGTTASGISCTTTSGNEKSGCTVVSDTDTTVSIQLTADDFYFDSYDETKFNYSIKLYRNDIAVSECSKTSPDVNGATDVTGTEYQCTFRVDSYDSTGQISVTTDDFDIRATISDTMSPISATPATSATLSWQLQVTEKNTAPTLSAFTSNSPLSEGQNLQFNITLSDLERDDFDYQVRYCTNDACTTSAGLTTSTLAERTDNNVLKSVSTSTYLPEDFLQGLTAITGCSAPARTVGTCNIKFFVVAVDRPTSAIAAETLDTSVLPNTPITVVIANTNPAPTFNHALASPNPLTFTGNSFVGFPFSMTAAAAGVITDDSIVVSEDAPRYQWYARNSSSVAAWTAIDSANGASLVWTPSLLSIANLLTDNPINLMLCVDDRPVAEVPTPVSGTSVCNDGFPWVITVRNNVVTTQDMNAYSAGTSLAVTDADSGTETAVWFDAPSLTNSVTSSAAYTVSVVNTTNQIQVKKTLVRNDGQMVPDPTANVVLFNALPSGATDSVKDLSITGTSTSLYISYLAASSLAPNTYNPQVRRIDITAGKTASNNHSGKLGFDYDGIVITPSCSTVGDCVATNQATGLVPTLFFGASAVDDTNYIDVVTAQGTVRVDFELSATYVVGQICADCTGATQAAQFAAAINASTAAGAMGITAAVTAASTVSIYGSQGLDYVDGASGVNARNSSQMGSLYISGGRWYVPFINTSLGGSYVDKISILSGAVDVNINQAGAIVLAEPNTDAGLNTLPAVSRFSNSYDGTSLWTALVTKTGSIGRLYRHHPTAFTYQAITTMMSGTTFSDVQVSANGTNVIVAGTLNETPTNMMIGVYAPAVNPTITTRGEFKFDNTASVTSPTSDYFNGDDIGKFRIVAYGNEARMVASSKGTGADYQLYMARVYTDGSSWYLNCGDCDQITDSVQLVSPAVNIGFSPVRTKVLSTDYRLSTDGATLNQGIKDVVFMSFGQMNAAGTLVNPALGVLNVEAEQISATAIPSATPDAGLYRSPLIKN